MSIISIILIVLATVFVMEWVAWSSHKYIMHGWGWGWHRDHHEPHNNALEKNDLYGIVGAAIGTLIASVTCEFTINVYKSCKITAVSLFTFFRRSLLPGILCAIPCLYLASVDEVSTSVLDLFVMNVLYGSAAVLLFVCFFVDAADRSFFGKLLLNSESRDAKTNSEVSSKSISATR